MTKASTSILFLFSAAILVGCGEEEYSKSYSDSNQCQIILEEDVSSVPLPSCVSSGGVYYVAENNGSDEASLLADLKALHNEPPVKGWMAAIEKELRDTPFFIGYATGLNEVGINGWNYFDIGAGVHVSGIDYDAPMQTWVKTRYPGVEVPGIIYGRDLATDEKAAGTVRNEVFERLAAVRIRNQGFSQAYEEFSGFQAIGWGIDRVNPQSNNAAAADVVSQVNTFTLTINERFYHDSDNWISEINDTVRSDEALKELLGDLILQKFTETFSQFSHLAYGVEWSDIAVAGESIPTPAIVLVDEGQ